MKKKVFETITVTVGLVGTLLISYSVSPSEYGFGIAEDGGHFPMAMINLIWFKWGINLIVLSILLQIYSIWFLKPSR